MSNEHKQREVRARLVYMNIEFRKILKVYLWQVFEVEKIVIETTRHKYQRETKWVYCKNKTSSTGMTRFLWYEVELLPEISKPFMEQNKSS